MHRQNSVKSSSTVRFANLRCLYVMIRIAAVAFSCTLCIANAQEKLSTPLLLYGYVAPFVPAAAESKLSVMSAGALTYRTGLAKTSL